MTSDAEIGLIAPVNGMIREEDWNRLTPYIEDVMQYSPMYHAICVRWWMMTAWQEVRLTHM